MENSCFPHIYFCCWYCREKYEIGSCLILISLSFLLGEVIAHSESVLCCSVEEASLLSPAWNEFCSHWRWLGCPSTPLLAVSGSRMVASAGLFLVSGAGKGWASPRPTKTLCSAKELTPSCSTCIGQLSVQYMCYSLVWVLFQNRNVFCAECLEFKLSANSGSHNRNAQEVQHLVGKKGNLVWWGHSHHIF